MWLLLLLNGMETAFTQISGTMGPCPIIQSIQCKLKRSNLLDLGLGLLGGELGFGGGNGFVIVDGLVLWLLLLFLLLQLLITKSTRMAILVQKGTILNRAALW